MKPAGLVIQKSSAVHTPGRAAWSDWRMTAQRLVWMKSMDMHRAVTSTKKYMLADSHGKLLAADGWHQLHDQHKPAEAHMILCPYRMEAMLPTHIYFFYPAVCPLQSHEVHELNNT